MYKLEELRKYQFFDDLLNNNDLSNILDPLTGVVLRNHLFDYVKVLIKNNTPFSLGIMDLDNFKSVNDNYGHQVGDLVLIDVAEGLRKALIDKGIVARFGGDEFVFIYFGGNDYDNLHNLLDRFYDGSVIRKNLRLGDLSLFVTATTGICDFPGNAKNYDDLFVKADKTLYRGKSKGRNCFIIYVEKKHANIDVTKLITTDLYTLLYNLNFKFDHSCSFFDKMRNCANYLITTKKISNFYYVDKDDIMHDVEKGTEIFNIRFEKVMNHENIFKLNDITKIQAIDKDVYEKLHSLNILSILIIRIKNVKEHLGYVIFAEDKINRLWQVEDEASLFFFATIIKNYLVSNKEK